jgi:hypothetical protein
LGSDLGVRPRGTETGYTLIFIQKGRGEKQGKINGTVCSNTVVLPCHEKKKNRSKEKKALFDGIVP